MDFKFEKNIFSSVGFSREEMQAALEYWTEERMENAIPDESLVPDPDGIESVPRPTTLMEVKDADTDEMPFEAGGKLFFTRNGSDYVASAQYCADPFILLTAAHCLYNVDEDAYSEKIVFKRCYSGLTSEQTTAIKCTFLPDRYLTAPKDYSFDYGFAITNDPAECDFLDYEINNAGGTAISYGYPSNYNRGRKMVYAEGAYTQEGTQNLLVMPGNDMGKGCSGGCWVKKGTNTVVSVNSFSKTSHPEDQYGPLLTDNFEKLLNKAREQLAPNGAVRYFTLHNSGAFVARMQIWWCLKDDTGTYEEQGYHDICVSAERTIDLKSIGGAIPEGARVRLIVEVVAGKDKTAQEEFIYLSDSGERAVYKISGTTLKSKLKLI